MLSTFPKFDILDLEDKDSYNELVRPYPSFSDISFPTLQIWWNLDNNLRVSSLNRNLIIKYYLPFDEENSGYSLVGRNSIDKSLKTLLAFLIGQDEKVKLVHVPEFTIKKITTKDHLVIDEEEDYHEYIIDSYELARLEGSSHSRIRRKVNRFLREVGDQKLQLREVNLASPKIRELIINSVDHWSKKHPRNSDPKNTEKLAMERTLKHHMKLGIRNLSLFVDGNLQGVILYHQSLDGKYFIINHLKVDYDIPFIFDYLSSQIALKAHGSGVHFLNMEMDLGIEGLRRHKQGLRPVKYFKKYTVSIKDKKVLEDWS